MTNEELVKFFLEGTLEDNIPPGREYMRGPLGMGMSPEIIDRAYDSPWKNEHDFLIDALAKASFNNWGEGTTEGNKIPKNNMSSRDPFIPPGWSPPRPDALRYMPPQLPEEAMFPRDPFQQQEPAPSWEPDRPPAPHPYQKMFPRDPFEPVQASPQFNEPDTGPFDGMRNPFVPIFTGGGEGPGAGPMNLFEPGADNIHGIMGKRWVRNPVDITSWPDREWVEAWVPKWLMRKQNDPWRYDESKSPSEIGIEGNWKWHPGRTIKSGKKYRGHWRKH